MPEIAERLSRSAGWVSMRKKLLEELSPAISELLFGGAFPVYCYRYTLRPFRRMNGVSQDEIERFVKAVAGQRRSVREIELLAQAYFLGPASLREAIEAGKLNWSLEQLKSVPEDREGCSEFERVLLGDMDGLQKSLQRVMLKCQDRRLRALGPEVGAYLDYALQTPGLQRHRFLREPFRLNRQVAQPVFVQTLQRALRYRVVELQSLNNIAWFCLSQGEPPLPSADVDESFCQRPAYEEGALTDEPDLSQYDDLDHEALTDPSESEDD